MKDLQHFHSQELLRAAPAWVDFLRCTIKIDAVLVRCHTVVDISSALGGDYGGLGVIVNTAGTLQALRLVRILSATAHLCKHGQQNASGWSCRAAGHDGNAPHIVVELIDEGKHAPHQGRPGPRCTRGSKDG